MVRKLVHLISRNKREEEEGLGLIISFKGILRMTERPPTSSLSQSFPPSPHNAYLGTKSILFMGLWVGGGIFQIQMRLKGAAHLS
jgi:hypothetical protein